ncbi:M48 family metalloprotease [Aestuariibius insulae]|uniref:M48 family metalloprotease n=1 Tax=Aestuariibius insulae TaxID=2058287 RepID=UPI00345E74A5
MFRLIALAFAALLLAAPHARAQSLIRDAEIEYALKELAKPVLSAAGLSASQIRILVIGDSSLNAFVTDSQTMFLHSGLILKLESAAQLQAVMAHEAAHIANGHMARRTQNVRAASRAARLGILLAAAAAVSGNGEAAGPLAAGTAEAARRSFFAHTRAEESSADQAGVRYMVRAGIDPQAAVEVLDIFRGQEALSVSRQDAYTRTHPLTRDRHRAMAGFAASVPRSAPDPTAQYWFARAQGKLSAFTRNSSWTLRRARNDNSQIGVMRRAVAQHLKPDPRRAFALADQLIAMAPTDPFAHELRGQIFLESRQPAAAVSAYGQAVRLAPNNALILGGYGRALLAAGQPGQALDALERARARDGEDPRILRDLGQAYAKAGNNGMASLVTAERYALSGRLQDAALHAERASGLLPRGSASWQRAQDMLRAAK